MEMQDRKKQRWDHSMMHTTLAASQRYENDALRSFVEAPNTE
jgi:hypothetical protein